MMRIASLGSGSKGNATLVNQAETTILIDCGFSLRQFKQRLARCNLVPEDIDAILLTHEHSDHSGGVARLANAFDIPVWTTYGTARAVFDTDFVYRKLTGGKAFKLGCFEINPVTVPHDAGEPVQFIFQHMISGKKLGILTDTGHITNHIINEFDNLNGLLLEFNYDQTMLENGPYPYMLKQRVSGDLGHLSNDQSIDLLNQIKTTNLECLIAAHISEKNNDPAIVSDQLRRCKDIPPAILANQQAGFDWITI